MLRVRHIIPRLWMVGILAVTGCFESKSKLGAANDNFRIWCGDRACAWDVDEGKVEKVSTWHRRVYGIGLLTNPTQISQVVEMENVECVLLAILADVDDNAALYWQIDYDNDDIDNPEHSVEVDARDWKTAYEEARVPVGCNEARMIIRKEGRGRAVLAKAELSGDAYCAANPEPGSTAPAGGSDTATDCEPDGGPCEE